MARRPREKDEGFEEWLQTQPDEHLFCRDTRIRHPWEPNTAWRDDQGVHNELFICARCGTEKVAKTDRDGSPKNSKYDHAEDFVRVGGGRMTKQENAAIRLEGQRRRYGDL